MGLDITVYRKLEEVEKPKFDEYGELVNWNTEWQPGASMEWSEKHFPGRGEGVNYQKVYTWQERFGFRAGSYSAYNWWRRKLELFATDKDFHELIEFADNEGVIGPVISKKLLKDFEKNKEFARTYASKLNDGEWWFEQYENWHAAFKMASDNGAVEFH